MFEDSARTGYQDVILTVIGLAALLFNIEVGFILLVCALYVYITTRFGVFRRTLHPEAPHPQGGKNHATPRTGRTRR